MLRSTSSFDRVCRVVGPLIAIALIGGCSFAVLRSGPSLPAVAEPGPIKWPIDDKLPVAQAVAKWFANSAHCGHPKPVGKPVVSLMEPAVFKVRCGPREFVVDVGSGKSGRYITHRRGN